MEAGLNVIAGRPPSGPGPEDSRFRITPHPAAEAAARAFECGSQAATRQLLDTVLPHCLRMVDFGACSGLTALYAAGLCSDVLAFEPHPTHHELLARNVAENPELAPRIRLFRHGIGDGDSYAPLYAMGTADPGASVFRQVERQGMLCAIQDAVVPLRDAGTVLREVGIDQHTLLNIDIAGAEYAVLRSIGSLLGERKPWLLVAFHPFHLVAGADAYRTALLRLRCALEAAEALAAYRYLHLFDEEEGWCTIGPAGRMDFLRHYLLSAKPVPLVASPQYGFVHTVAFSEQALPQAG